MPTSLGKRIPPRGVTIMSTNTSKERTHFGTYFDCHIIDASGLKIYSAPKIYVCLEINKLIKMISSQGSETIKKPITNFFNQFQKEIEMKQKDICELGNLKTFLGKDVMDFVMSRQYLAYLEYYRFDIHIVRSYVSGSVMSVMASGSDLQKLAKDLLQPHLEVQVHEVKKIILPWVQDGHWLVLVFQSNQIFHLDSCKDNVHKPREKHSVFVRLICVAWQNLRGVDGYVVDNVTSINVFQQLDNNECGHLCIHNIMLYLKVRK